MAVITLSAYKTWAGIDSLDTDDDAWLQTCVDAVAAAVEAQWVQDLHVDRFAALAATVLEVNVDFFSRAMPLLRSLGAQVKAAQAPA